MLLFRCLWELKVNDLRELRWLRPVVLAHKEARLCGRGHLGKIGGKKKKESRLLEIVFNTFCILQRYKLTRITISSNILLFVQYIQNYYMSVFKGKHAVLFLKQHRPVVGGDVHKLIVM